MLYVYGALMPVRALEEVRFWKTQEKEHTVVIRTLVPDLEMPFVKLLAEWESVFEQTEIAAIRLLEAALRNGLVLPPPHQAEVSQLLAASAAQSREFIRQLMRMEQESEPIRSRPVVKTVIGHIIRESGYFLGVLQAGDPLYAARQPPASTMPDADIRNETASLAGNAAEGANTPLDWAWSAPAEAASDSSEAEAQPVEAKARTAVDGGTVHGDALLAAAGFAVQGSERTAAHGGTVDGDALLAAASFAMQDSERTMDGGSPVQADSQLTAAGSEVEVFGPLPAASGAAESEVEQSGKSSGEAESYREHSIGIIPAAKQEIDVQIFPYAPFSEINEEDGKQKVYLHSDDSTNTERLEPQHLSSTGEGTWTGVMSDGEMVPIGGHRLPTLPYAYNALEPHIDETTMRLHHDKHHKSYVDGLNRAEKKLAEARESGDFSLVKHWERELAFHGAGHYLHTLFWATMSPKGGGRPAGALAAYIDHCFGNFERFRSHFSEAASQVEGGGWAMLIWSPRSRRLEILQAEKHQNLSQQDILPLLPLDVWEHSYYLKYRNDRAKYISAWWNVVNWPAVEQRFSKAMQLHWPLA